MAHFGNGVEQGLHCLLVLAGQEAKDNVTVRDLAEFQGVSASFAAKLFTKLAEAGVVEAGEGLRGGYRLARPATDITVLEVADAIEGRKPIFRCREVRRGCVLYGDSPPAWATSGVCEIHRAMLEAEEAMRASLAGVTVQDLIDRTGRKLPATARNEAAQWFAARQRARGIGVNEE